MVIRRIHRVSGGVLISSYDGINWCTDLLELESRIFLLSWLQDFGSSQPFRIILQSGKWLVKSYTLF